METTLLLAVILIAGFAAAKVGQMLRLPSVTGFIAAGVLLGPSGLDIITAEATGSHLAHFTQIALMLIAFGIGEHLELKRLQKTAGTVLSICLADMLLAFLLVAGGIFTAAWLTSSGGPGWQLKEYMVLALILATVSIATAPGTILFITRECRAVGALTTALLQVVAVNNGLAIVLFGVALVLARQVVGVDQTIPGIILVILAKTSFSLLLGMAAGQLLDYLIHRLRDRGEMMTLGLALLLLSGEAARFLKLSPLLVGIAIGFVIVNRDRRDVRLFRTLNSFEPPIYVLFFTLAGAHLDFGAITVAGWLGFLYFLLRLAAKTGGAYLGGVFAGAPSNLRKYLGISLVPQAGVAIGLVFLINGEPELAAFADILTPTVLVGVLFAELIGPACTKFALESSGEAAASAEHLRGNGYLQPEAEGEVHLVPWSWEKLAPPREYSGAVIFGVSHQGTVGGLARMATILAHYFGAQPVAVKVNSGTEADLNDISIGELFDYARQEAASLGYTLKPFEIEAKSVARGLLAAARERKAASILLGYPLHRTEHSFSRIVEEISCDAACPIVVVRFSGILHTERILVPIVSSSDLETVGDTVCALEHVGQHSITLLRLLPADAQDKEAAEHEKRLRNWAAAKKLPFVKCIVARTEARLETIAAEAHAHDLLIMAVTESGGFRKMLLGSLADDVAVSCQRPMLMVYRSRSGQQG